MRNIKFRGKTPEGKWVYGNLLNEQTIGAVGNNLSHYRYSTVIPETVGQFTGLKDIFGNDVYEGDIVKLTNTGYGFNIGEVKWGLHGNPSFQALEIDAEFPATYHMQVKPQGIEVIGNIHDKETEANHG